MSSLRLPPLDFSVSGPVAGGPPRPPSTARHALYNDLRQMVDSTMEYGERAIKAAALELWDNPCPDRDYEVSMSFPEFTCLCPRSGYPDFAAIMVRYVPDKKIVELKSLKLFLNSFRDVPISHEEATNTVYDELRNRLRPRKLEVTGDFNPRGNLKTVIKVGDGF